MRFRLLEDTILTDEQEKEFNYLNPYKKYKYIEDYLKRLPNYKYLNSAKSVYMRNILENGFDIDDNPFLNFTLNIKTDLQNPTVKLIQDLIDNGSLNPKEQWLYDNSFYKNVSDSDLAFKIKAYTYASDKALQKNASSKININDLNGKSIKEIQDILKNISVESDSEEDNINKFDYGTIGYAIEKLYPDAKELKQKSDILIQLIALSLNKFKAVALNRKIEKLEKTPVKLKHFLNFKVDDISVEDIIEKTRYYFKG
jgi:hypothetical protein